MPFLCLYSQPSSLLLDMDDVRKVQACKAGARTEVFQELRRIVRSSGLGEKLFGGVFRHELLAAFAVQVGSRVAQLGPAISKCGFDRTLADCLETAAGVSDEFIEAKTGTIIDLLNCPIEIRCRTAQLFVRFRLAAAVKQASVGLVSGLPA